MAKVDPMTTQNTQDIAPVKPALSTRGTPARQTVLRGQAKAKAPKAAAKTGRR